MTKHNKVPDHIYYDINLVNNTNDYQIANLVENRTTALLHNPNDYHLSIVRYTIPTTFLPLFIYANANNLAVDTTYSVTLRYSNTDFRTYLIYTPQNNVSSTSQRRFFIYSYQHFIDMINTALNTSYLALKTAFPGATVTTPPYMVYNPETGYFSIIAETAYASGYELYMNNALYSFFDNFNAYFYGFQQTNGKDYLIYIKNTGGNTINQSPPPSYPSILSYVMTQEYSSTYLFNNVRALVFSSSLLGIRMESYNTVGGVNAGNSMRPVLTDFEFNLASGSQNSTLRNYVQYFSRGEYRLIDIIQTQPIYMVDIQIYFQLQNGDLYPLYIAPGEFISIKIMFRDRSLKVGL